jgi:tryptophan synthase alpha subunit
MSYRNDGTDGHGLSPGIRHPYPGDDAQARAVAKGRALNRPVERSYPDAEQIAAALESAVENVACRVWLRVPSDPLYDGDHAALRALQQVADRARWELLAMADRAKRGAP